MKGKYLSVRVIARAGRNQISDLLEDGTFKIRVNAPPIEGKANRNLIKFLSEILGMPRSNIHIVRGEKAREKKIEFSGYDIEEIEFQLEKYLAVQAGK